LPDISEPARTFSPENKPVGQFYVQESDINGRLLYLFFASNHRSWTCRWCAVRSRLQERLCSWLSMIRDLLFRSSDTLRGKSMPHRHGHIFHLMGAIPTDKTYSAMKARPALPSAH